MSEKTKILVKYIEENNYTLFNLFLLTDDSELDFTYIDSALLKNKEFNFDTKIRYIKKYNRDLLLRDLMNDIKYQYFAYDYYAIFYMALNHIKSDKKRGFYLLESFARADIRCLTHLYYLLTDNNVYDQFKLALMNNNSSTLKIKAAIFLDTNLILELYKDNIKFIKAIQNSNLALKAKIEYLLGLSQRIELSNEELNCLKETIIDIAKSYNDQLNEELATIDEELVKYNNAKFGSEVVKLLRIIDTKKGKSYLHK